MQACAGCLDVHDSSSLASDVPPALGIILVQHHACRTRYVSKNVTNQFMARDHPRDVVPCAPLQPAATRTSPAVPVVYNAGVPQLSDEQRRRAEAAVALKFGGGAGLGVGAKLMARMGFGASEGSKGGLGRDEHVRRALTQLQLPLVQQAQQSDCMHGVPESKPGCHEG
jgi:hypothetical protein